MRIVIAPDSFGQTLTAPEAARSIADGLGLGADSVRLPMSDGGPGFIDVLRGSIASARAIDVPTTGPHGEAVTGTVLLDGAGRGFVESAQAAGLQATERRDPLWASSYGVGTLMLAAVEAGARTVVVGLGGSATNDGGAGLLAALGVVAYDAAGVAVPVGALPLLGVDHLAGTAAMRTARVVAATDVDNPLCGPDGASAVFGPQKGASPDDVRLLDAALAHWGAVLERDRPVSAPIVTAPGAGAAGGMGAALLSLRAVRRSGFEVVSEAVGLGDAVADASLVITGEGSFDEQSVRGKVVSGVARLAQEQGVPCVVVAGRVSLGRRQAAAYGIDRSYSLVEHAGEQRAMHEAADVLREVSEQIARDWLR
ncbi:glycerate kinase family protein [Cumulibacter manganitolerans]|uniref:glycerate kinase family protein n=1 Tax=Cumulibacter manganitolerans TaxID=1884992 RepID=UPI001296E504|nr:glycerate kinase [Cumulibacter manganitolerans]